MTERISVIVPTYRRRECVRRLLAALMRQTLAPHLFEVMICIDGSEDGTREMVASFSAEYKLVSLWQPNAGRARACNLGGRYAAGEILLFLDDDMEPEPDCLAAHLRAHTPGCDFAVLGAVPVVRYRSADATLDFIDAKFNRFLKKLAQPGYRIGVRDFFTGNTSIRRDLFQSAGGFDEEFRLYGLEDCELAVRLGLAGAEFVFAPDAVARQHYLKSFSDLARDTTEKGWNEVMLARKHPQVTAALRVGSYRRCSRKRRVFRTAMLGLTRLAPFTPKAVVRLMSIVGRLRPVALYHCYELALDYFFWLGVRRAGGIDFNGRRGRADAQGKVGPQAI